MSGVCSQRVHGKLHKWGLCIWRGRWDSCVCICSMCVKMITRRWRQWCCCAGETLWLDGSYSSPNWGSSQCVASARETSGHTQTNTHTQMLGFGNSCMLKHFFFSAESPKYFHLIIPSGSFLIWFGETMKNGKTLVLLFMITFSVTMANACCLPRTVWVQAML